MASSRSSPLPVASNRASRASPTSAVGPRTARG
jgi:hypothetical protein